MARLPNNPFAAASVAGTNPFEPDETGGTDPQPPPNTNQDPTDTWGNYLFNTDPSAGLAAYEHGAGIDATSAYGRFLGQQSNNLYGGYSAASAANPNLNYTDYLAQQQPTERNWYGVAQTANYSPFRRGR